TALLQGTSPPAELRLFASQATTAATAPASIDDFSRRLAYFERPGRSRVLQQLYERASLALTAAQQERDPNVSRALATTNAPLETQKRNARRTTVAGMKMVAAALIVGTVAGLIVFEWTRLRTAGQRSPAARVLNKTSALVGSVTASGIASGRALLGKVGLINEPNIVAEPT